jgi:hypothetical protein
MDHAAKDALVKVYFRLDPGDWHGRPNEGLWAEPIGPTGPATVFSLRNSPFFVRGVSFLDTVRAAPRTDGAGMEFSGVLAHGGHSTYMLLVPPESRGFDSHWHKLSELGCTYESTSLHLRGGDKVLYSVDVPPSSDIWDVYSILQNGERNSAWMFQEGHVGHKLRSG